jgi:hypothetical protein
MQGKKWKGKAHTHDIWLVECAGYRTISSPATRRIGVGSRAAFSRANWKAAVRNVVNAIALVACLAEKACSRFGPLCLSPFSLPGEVNVLMMKPRKLFGKTLRQAGSDLRIHSESRTIPRSTTREHCWIPIHFPPFIWTAMSQ